MSEVPANFIIKVYDTLAKAQTGLASEALFAEDANTDPIISNNSASEQISATGASAGNSGTTLVASTPTFGSHMVGWTVNDAGAGAATTIATYTNPTQVVTTGTHNVANDEAFIIEPTPGSQPVFYTYKKYYFRIEATDPVSGFVIDWDDGENNSPEDANRQRIDLDSTAYYAVVDHVYTKHGKFYPMVRTINPEGFLSKFYVSYGAQNDSTNTLAGLENRVLTYIPRDAGDAQNNSSVVSPDVQQGAGQNPRIPEFAPANVPPIAVLKTDRTSVYSGIDNEPVNGLTSPKAYCLLQSTSRAPSGSGTVSIADIDVIYETSTNLVVKETVTAINDNDDAAIQAVDFPSTGNLKRILSVKLTELRETTDSSTTGQLMADERIWIKVYDTDSSGTPVTTSDPDITFVSNGCPIQTLDRPGFYLTADGSESIARNSNLIINKYLFDSGKSIANSNSSTSTTSIQVTSPVTISGDQIGQQTSDVFSNGNGLDCQPVQTTPTIKLSYSLSPEKHALVYDSDTTQYYAEERLLRLQVRDNASDTRVDTGKDTIEASYIEHWDNVNYDGDTLVTFMAPTTYTSRGLLLHGSFTGGTTVATDFRWTNRADDFATVTISGSGGSGEVGVVFGGAIDNPTTLGTTNDTQLVGINGASDSKGRAANYLLACQSKKFNRIHFRLDNGGGRATASSVISGNASQQIRLRAWYAAPDTPGSSTYKWKPLSIRDGTALDFEGSSLRRSGSISFDSPEDWATSKSSDLGANWTGPEAGMDADSAGSNGPENVWTSDMYAIMIGITSMESTYQPVMRCSYVLPYNNPHSQPIKIVDPHHKSLNDMAIAQSISWSRSGEYANIKDKYGRTELRKIGVLGGSVIFGGVELNGSYSTQKKLLNKYQRKGIPVYLDIQRAKDSGEYIRFYGVLTDMSEDYPTGNQHPKFALTMQIENVLEYDANGNWVSEGLMGLGGEIIDEPRYSL